MKKFHVTSSILTVLLAGTIVLPAAEKQAIYPPAAKPGGPYTPGILTGGGTLYVAGQLGRDANGQLPENFEDEVKQCLDNAGAILKQAGYDFKDAVSVQVYLTDMGLFQRMNEVYTKYFPEPRPARTTVGVAKLVGPARIEITITAWKEPAAPGKAKKAKRQAP
jgi:reactive intermediate/imine deaminase